MVCTLVYSTHHGLSTQVAVGIEEGLKHESCIHCDELISLPETALKSFVGTLHPSKIIELDRALIAAVGIEVE